MKQHTDNLSNTYKDCLGYVPGDVKHFLVLSISTRLALRALRTYYASAATDLSGMLSVGSPCCSRLRLVCDGAFKCRMRSEEVPDPSSLKVRERTRSSCPCVDAGPTLQGVRSDAMHKMKIAPSRWPKQVKGIVDLLRAYGIHGLCAVGVQEPCSEAELFDEDLARRDHVLRHLVEEVAPSQRCRDTLTGEVPGQRVKEFLSSFACAVEDSTKNVYTGKKACPSPSVVIHELREFIRRLLLPAGRLQAAAAELNVPNERRPRAASHRHVTTLPPLARFWRYICSGAALPTASLEASAKAVRKVTRGKVAHKKARASKRKKRGAASGGKVFVRHPFYFVLALLPMRPGLRSLLRQAMLSRLEDFMAELEDMRSTGSEERAHVKRHLELTYRLLSTRLVIDEHGRMALDVGGDVRDWIVLGHTMAVRSQQATDFVRRLRETYDSIVDSLAAELDEARGAGVQNELSRAQGHHTSEWATLREIVRDFLNVNSPLRAYTPTPLERAKVLLNIASPAGGTAEEWALFREYSPFLEPRIGRHAMREDERDCAGAKTATRYRVSVCLATLLRCLHHSTRRTMDLVHGSAKERLKPPARRVVVLDGTACPLRTGHAMWVHAGARQAAFVPAIHPGATDGSDGGNGGMEEEEGKDEDDDGPASAGEAGYDGAALATRPAGLRELNVCPGGMCTLPVGGFAAGGKVGSGDCARKSFVGAGVGDEPSGTGHQKRTAGVFSVMCPKHHVVLGASPSPSWVTSTAHPPNQASS